MGLGCVRARFVTHARGIRADRVQVFKNTGWLRLTTQATRKHKPSSGEPWCAAHRPRQFLSLGQPVRQPVCAVTWVSGDVQGADTSALCVTMVTLHPQTHA